jgi:CMP-N-acetylneuraminic acid synthetase
MKNVALIPLRGGSKGVLKKNIKMLNGKPLCAWVLEAASRATSIDEVYVSTDCEEIIETVDSLNLAIKILKRPYELATDGSSTESVIVHFSKSVEFDRLVTIQATSPLLKSVHLDEAIAKFGLDKLDSLLSVWRLRQFLWNEDGAPLNYDPLIRPRRQDFSGQIVENGAFYISTRKQIEKTLCRVGGKVGFYEMTETESVEIDELIDFKCAALYLNSETS